MAISREIYRLGFQISPVIFCDGIAAGIPGGMLPVVAITQSASFVSGLLSGAFNLTSLDKYFCHWRPAQGGTLIDYDIARYPFFNQSVAANALLAQPLRIPMMMSAPVNENTGAITKLVTLSALQSVIEAHSNLGGTYVVATPAAFYSGCVLKTVSDVTSGSEPLPQSQWLWDFEKPLITQKEAANAVNSFLGKLDSGDKVNSSAWTNTFSALGNTALGSGISGVAGDLSNVAGKITGLIGRLGL
ncbi:hypothetical protein BL250_02305 [Erwinia sp. OLTSP20]|uniref:hypothetical protein n=1 Tax=unclassified Erwinia TaxID=2622719 RepID=UPI000C17EB49|nr:MULTISPECIES: hypothetical protein [unclassified Erwinia]PIJ48824.1 hypothetical protein BV501_16240 [Erwinia sp. OAMSP11]PIJ69446.1 hypothetical protein BK416_15180 [Erwinia sp. OLSSP12]PIJ79280.1 hypothetical protein BLD47_15485 [Erwinia sp. OLCASP19]PIJ80806.1 hypothetical protein BLD46_14645 [Erwinia sp. OLMTSP26]PIJ82958.1 hypothetical protein BLD49_14540 [Erwinia sp. OLMDSP33]